MRPYLLDSTGAGNHPESSKVIETITNDLHILPESVLFGFNVALEMGSDLSVQSQGLEWQKEGHDLMPHHIQVSIHQLPVLAMDPRLHGEHAGNGLL